MLCPPSGETVKLISNFSAGCRAIPDCEPCEGDDVPTCTVCEQLNASHCACEVKPNPYSPDCSYKQGECTYVPITDSSMNQCYGCTNGEKSPKSGSCDDGNTCTGQGACNAFGGCDAVPDDTIDPGVACKKCSGGNIVGDLNKNGRSCGEGRVCQAGYCVLGESDDELPPSNTATGTVIEPPSGSGDSCSSVLFSSASVTSNSQTSDLDLKEDITESVPVYIPFNETISGAQAVFSLIAQSVDVSCDMEFEWNFGDGGTSTEQHPVYFYENAGEYEVVIKARCSECSGWWAEVRAKVVVVRVEVTELTDLTTFTTLTENDENIISVTADILPDSLDSDYNSKIQWEIDDDPSQTGDSGDPADPQSGSEVDLEVTAPNSPNGRGYPLNYRIQGYIEIDSVRFFSKFNFVDQNEVDQCRQEYIDMNKNSTPGRAEFVSQETYNNPGNFSFGEMNSGELSVAIISIAGNLQNIRAELGALVVNSGFRNPIHNAAVGGTENSRHIYGDAADIRTTDFDGDGVIENGIDGEDTLILLDAARREGAEFTRLYPTHVHMDWR